MAQQVSLEHHIVPKVLLRPWLVEDPKGHFNLHGYWWDDRRQQVSCKLRGLSGFCFKEDLLTMDAHKQGRDVIERVFFGEVDTKGTAARDLMLKDGIEALTADTRSDFARLVLSLVARLPENVKRLRDQRTALADGLDNDKDILAAAQKHGFDLKPSEIYEQTRGSLGDQALLVVQPLVDNPEVGRWLINTTWGIKELTPGEGTFVLADRPLVRHGGYDNPKAIWALPLTPMKVFIAANRPSDLAQLMRVSERRFAKVMNSDSARRAERYVFSVDPANAVWLGKVLAKQRSSLRA